MRKLHRRRKETRLRAMKAIMRSSRRRRAAEEDDAMNASDRSAHWENVYRSKGEREVSWFQETPAVSLALIEATGATRQSALIDIGGGASRLVDALLEKGYTAVTVLDLSEAALAVARARLGA